jgi:hypothetical protein
MAEYLDVIVGKTDEGASFTVNNAVNYVDATRVTDKVLISGGVGGLPYFQQGDSLLVQTIGIIMPIQFCLWPPENAGEKQGAVPILLQGQYSGGTKFDFTVFGSSHFIFPMENYEVAINGYFDASATTGKYKIIFDLPKSGSQKMRVSMVNVPAALNGLTFYIVPFIKVLHNLPMVA